MDASRRSNDDLFPEPYTMCPAKECEERQRYNEVSIWEATERTCNKKLPRDRRLDPSLAISKYRRSAAGVKHTTSPRSLKDLQTTLRHLFQIVLTRQRAHAVMKRQSLVSTVNFIDDRIRAIQVDLVKGQQVTNSVSLQAQLVRYHVLVMYLLSDVSCGSRPKYEVKFAAKALSTAIGAYWSDKTETGLQDNDEILCFTILCHVASFLQQDEPTNTSSVGMMDSPLGGYSSLLQVFWSIIRQQDSTSSAFSPKLRLALDIASAAHIGHYRLILRLLSEVPKATSFAMTCRCCMAPALRVVRLGALRQYNKALGKGEKVSGQEMARLLFLPNAQAALEFCAYAGLPLYNDTHVVLKAAPISITENQSACNRKNNDLFIFAETNKWLKEAKINDASSREKNSARVDEDGVLIPPGSFFEEMIQF